MRRNCKGTWAISCPHSKDTIPPGFCQATRTFRDTDTKKMYDTAYSALGSSAAGAAAGASALGASASASGWAAAGGSASDEVHRV